jgi:hypothetical protein
MFNPILAILTEALSELSRRWPDDLPELWAAHFRHFCWRFGKNAQRNQQAKGGRLKLWQRLWPKGPAQIEREIEAELRFHLEMRIEQNRAAGMSAEAAQADALQRFGNYDAVKTECQKIAKERLANSLARRILNALIWVMLGVGLTLRFLDNIEAVQQCGTILIVISVSWQLLVYMRLSGQLRKSETLPNAPMLPIETLTSTDIHNPIPSYDEQGRTPVERVLSGDE